jgi:flagellar protein FliS
MSYGAYSSNRYLETAVLTATPEQLVVITYEETIRRLKQAIGQIDSKDFEGKRRTVNQALAMVHHLQSCLDMQRGGEISSELRQIYTYVSSKIVEGSMQLKTDPLYEAVNLLSTLLESWREIASRKDQPAVMSARMVG